MTRRIVFNHPKMPEMLLNLAGVRCLPDDTNIATERDGVLLGGFVFTNYTGEGGSIIVHDAGQRHKWCTRELLLLAFHYPFKQLKCRKIFATVPADNTEAMKIDLRAGFTYHTTLEGMLPQGDMIVLHMHVDDCKWLKYPLRGG